MTTHGTKKKRQKIGQIDPNFLTTSLFYAKLNSNPYKE